jgi:hypothetical protein
LDLFKLLLDIVVDIKGEWIGEDPSIDPFRVLPPGTEEEEEEEDHPGMQWVSMEWEGIADWYLVFERPPVYPESTHNKSNL